MNLESAKKIFRPFYYEWKHYTNTVKNGIFRYLKVVSKPSAYDIPIVINNRNRLSFLKRLIASLHNRGYRNVFIIDNNSTYPPLLEFYKECDCKVFMLNKNYGYKAIWESGIYKQFINNYYVYTDSDLELIKECPNNFLAIFMEAMEQNSRIVKIGLGLKIDDLPDCYDKKADVITWEKKYTAVSFDNKFYKADIDTTFALYRPGIMCAANAYVLMLRGKSPLVARHLPWYVDSKNLETEEKYYIENVVGTHWMK